MNMTDTETADVDIIRMVHLMNTHSGSTVEVRGGNDVDLRTLQDNQSVAKGGDNYYFLITRKI